MRRKDPRWRVAQIVNRIQLQSVSYLLGAVLLLLWTVLGSISCAPEEDKLVPSQGFLTRQSEYLLYCAENNGPGQGSWEGQTCRVATGATTYNEPKIDEALQRMADRRDTADFRLAAMVRMLYLNDRTGALPDSLRVRIEEGLRNFKYWIDEPGQDKMCYWTENHQILYHSGELLVGQRFFDQVLSNDGKTGAEHVAHATRMLHRWLDFRMRFGFSEWHSNVYYNEDLPALLNLADFAEDRVIRERAAIALDILSLDLLNNTYAGLFATTHGRTYDSKLLKQLNDSTKEFTYIALGLGDRGGANNFAGAFLATSPNYAPPALLESLAARCQDHHEHRQRDSIEVAEGQKYGYGYESDEDIIFWAGLSAIMTPEVIDGTMAFLDRHELWDGFLFGDLPEEIRQLVEEFRETDLIKKMAENLEPLSRGMALETTNTYTYRTPYYQLSGAQALKPGYWGTQTHTWQATLDKDAYVFTTFPGIVTGVDDLSMTFAGPWIGGWFPRAAFHKNVGVILYQLDELPALVETLMTTDYVHAFFPKDRFDEFEQRGQWTFGRKGDGFVGLWSQQATRWADPTRDSGEVYELVVDGRQNVWIVELGSTEENGSFSEFINKLAAAEISVNDGLVEYASPSLGQVEFGWQAPLTVAQQPIDIGPYERFENDFVTQSVGSLQVEVNLDDQRLLLDYEQGTRRIVH